MSSSKYIKVLSDFDMIDKFSFSGPLNISFLKVGELFISIFNSETDDSISFARSSLLLEFLAACKSSVRTFKVSMKGKMKKQFLFVNKILLRNKCLFSFLYFFFFFVYLNLKPRNIVINRELEVDQYCFALKDVSIFPGSSEHFIKWGFSLFFLFGKSKDHAFQNKLQFERIFRNFGLEINVKLL